MPNYPNTQMMFHNYADHTNHTADEATTQDERGRWWINPAFAGYNCPANNGFGFASQADAIAAINRYQSK